MFSTQQLRFRAYQPADQENILALWNDPRVLSGLTEGNVVPLSADHFDKLNFMIKDSVMFCVVEELEGGAFVGISAILTAEPKDRNATFGIAVSPSLWHKGYGGEITNFMVDHAFQHLAVHRISLTVFEGNDRAIALYKRIGFVEEARTRKLVWIDGGWRDLVHMGILDDEWAALKKQWAEERSMS
ncbi:putative acetyltransferase (GNAT) domain containing protein [Lyophyllum shimeji]|uniref:Acetyltransferase (GNAT) domain containing protein n=1 Tax=Lyophyllum shimeji TaxID=47721 RepID=A0A9P3PL14_LYOSH|nr:putative acetyltransferase (GNAT) domain containing protein [Lyophyllum shimeji]